MQTGMDLSDDGNTTRSKPNILITGTPGVGKTTLAEMVSDMTQFDHVNISQLVIDNRLYQGKDDRFGSFIIDEDKVSPKQ